MATQHTADDEAEQLSSQDRRGVDLGCYRYFGIRSHLHHFYDYGQGAGECESQNPLLQPKKSKRCSPLLWKIVLWFGVIFLIIGASLILVGHFTPRRQLLNLDPDNKRFASVDVHSESFNNALDSLGTLGITLFCIGGALIVIAVILPTQCSEFCLDEDDTEDSATQASYMRLPSQEPLTPVDKTVPATQVLASVQPAWSSDDSYKPIE